MPGRGPNSARFIALIDELRQKITHERITSLIKEIKQDELIALLKLEAELKSRYLVAVLELIDPKMTDLAHHLDEARRFREMTDEVGIAVKNIVDGVLAQEIPMPGLTLEPDLTPEVERAIEIFMQTDDHYWDQPE
ncbi:MAG TPA: hypothetical protein HPQ04_00370 [Rhodospirillaceae bacterium]|nr:hypothetical protein [Rhodospirillaceae bacterium]